MKCSKKKNRKTSVNIILKNYVEGVYSAKGNTGKSVLRMFICHHAVYHKSSVWSWSHCITLVTHAWHSGHSFSGWIVCILTILLSTMHMTTYNLSRSGCAISKCSKWENTRKQVIVMTETVLKVYKICYFEYSCV